MPERSRPSIVSPPALAFAWVVVCLALIYVPDLGRGFVKDDFRWIVTSRLQGLADLQRVFVETPMGFYRPLVAISFGVSHSWFGLNPFPYGLTNLLLVVAIAASIVMLVRALGLSAGVGVFAAALWAFNFHGINMAILWISGRTSLLATLFAVWAACAFAMSRFLLTGVFVLLSLLSKEEPIMLPIVLAGWAAIDGMTRGGPPAGVFKSVVRSTWPSFIAVTAYFLLRAQSPAFTPDTAPDVYRLTSTVISSNVIQYVDRSLTFAAGILLLAGVLLVRRRFPVDAVERRMILKGCLWLTLGFALTIMLPVRSSLYVCFPSIGTALIGAAIASAEWRAIPRQRQAIAIALVIPLLLLPAYRARNTRLKNEALLSARVLRQLVGVASRGQVDRVVVYDHASERPSLADAFADTLPIAFELVLGRQPAPSIALEPAVPDTARTRSDSDRTIDMALSRGTLVRF